MTIDGINILTTFNLKLSTVQGNLKLPARKKILQNPGFDQKDIKFEEHTVTVILFGTYASKESLATMVQNLKALIASKTVHEINIYQHQATFDGIFLDGVKVETYGTTALLTIPITVTNE